ncbi:hypothetical protein SAZ11_06740 [Streptomyces sp. FXJ1.4098]|nr:hypothetical protein [Streptomyces sp. FXJ1.4098]
MNPSPNPASPADGPLPLIAVTMGDGAGIGPEVVVPALLDQDTLRRCRPVVIGDAARLRQAARLRASTARSSPSPGPRRPSSPRGGSM